jgi:hypothetical protein
VVSSNDKHPGGQILNVVLVIYFQLIAERHIKITPVSAGTHDHLQETVKTQNRH